jgi:uncharacterized GH25 family protein
VFRAKAYFTNFLLILCAIDLAAHDIMLIPQSAGGQIKLTGRYGEPGSWGTASVGKLMDALAYQPDGRIVPLNKGLKQDGANFQVIPVEAGSQSGLWIFTTAYDGGFTVKTTDDRTINSTKMDYPAATSSYHNLKFGKTLVAIGEHKSGYDRVVGHRLEIVPQADPFTLKADEKLPVLVLFDGKPLVGEEVEAGDETVLMWPDIEKPKTNAKGMAMMPVHSGLNRMAIEIERPTRTPALVDKDGYSASLIFISRMPVR